MIIKKKLKLLKRYLRKGALLAIAILIMLGPTFWLKARKPKPKVKITNSGSTQTDFQVAITLDTATLITAGNPKKSYGL